MVEGRKFLVAQNSCSVVHIALVFKYIFAGLDWGGIEGFELGDKGIRGGGLRDLGCQNRISPHAQRGVPSPGLPFNNNCSHRLV